VFEIFDHNHNHTHDKNRLLSHDHEFFLQSRLRHDHVKNFFSTHGHDHGHDHKKISNQARTRVSVFVKLANTHYTSSQSIEEISELSISFDLHVNVIMAILLQLTSIYRHLSKFIEHFSTPRPSSTYIGFCIIESE
jgi:hypothetical protein